MAFFDHRPHFVCLFACLYCLFQKKNVLLDPFLGQSVLSHASNNTTSRNIGRTNAWAVPTSNFGGDHPQSPISLRPCSQPTYLRKHFTSQVNQCFITH